MKKQLLILLTLAVLPFNIACDSTSPEDELIGDWLSQSLRITGCEDPGDNAEFDPMSTASCTESSTNGCIYQAFSFTATDYVSTSNALNNGNLANLSQTGSYSVSGSSAEFCETGMDFCRMGNFSISGNTLTISNLEGQGSSCVTGVTATRIL